MSEEITVLASNITSNMTPSTMEEEIKIDANETVKINNPENSTPIQIDSIKPIVQSLPISPYFYPWSPYLFRARPYEPYYPPYLMPVVPPLFRSASPAIPAEENFPIDDELSQEDALKELEAIRQELSADLAARQHENRLLFPSITLDPISSSVTVSAKSFASLLRSLSSRVTVTLATRTILVPSISVIN